MLEVASRRGGHGGGHGRGRDGNDHKNGGGIRPSDRDSRNRANGSTVSSIVTETVTLSPIY